jgi:hypothetical protein
MSLFSKKKELTHAQVGKLLADCLIRDLRLEFESEMFSTFSSLFTNVDAHTLQKEWILFTMFAMFQAVGTYFKNSEEGFQILDEFHDSCSVIFYEAGIFENPSTFIELLLSRYGTYGAALKETAIPNNPFHIKNPLLRLSKEFRDICEKGNDDFLVSHVAIEQFVNTCKTTNKLISDLLKSVRIMR